MSEEIVCRLREGNDFLTSSCLLDKPLNQFCAVYKYIEKVTFKQSYKNEPYTCLLYTSDAADEEDSVDLGGRRIIKKNIVISHITQELSKSNKAKQTNK